MAKRKKVSKPSRDYPLFAHAAGQWAKKIDGKLVYFGVLATPELARERYDNFRKGKGKVTDSELAEMSAPGEITLEVLCNRFLASKLALVENSELSRRTLEDYTATCERLISALGFETVVTQISIDRFKELRSALAKSRGHVTLTNELQRIRSVFKFAYDEELIAAPIRLATSLKPPTRKSIRIEKSAKPKKLFSAAEIRQILASTGVQLRAMALLGINAGFGNSDIATLPDSVIDLKSGWLNYPRPKTGASRRAWLWPETVEALKAVLAERPEATSDDASGCVFITRWGSRWVHLAEAGTYVDSVGREYRKLLLRLKLKRPGINFYSLRHCFETVAGECLDQPAIDLVMGHSEDRNDMGANYRQDISDDRLQRVSQTVRKWLWPAGSEAAQLTIDAQAATEDEGQKPETPAVPKPGGKRTSKK